MNEEIENAKNFLEKELQHLKENQMFFSEGSYLHREVESYEILLDYIKDLEENAKALKVLTDDMRKGRLVYISSIKRKIDSIFE